MARILFHVGNDNYASSPIFISKSHVHVLIHSILELVEWNFADELVSKTMSTHYSPASASICSDNQLPLPPNLLSRKSGIRNFSYPFSLTEKTAFALKASTLTETARDSFATPPNQPRPSVVKNAASSQSPPSATQIYGG